MLLSPGPGIAELCYDTSPRPPFAEEPARQKARLAEEGWNSRDPAKVALAYTLDTQWRNRAHCVTNRQQAETFLTGKWIRENEHRPIKQRLFRWPQGRRPDEHPGLSELGL